MILEEETFEAFGYYPSKLKSQSGKRILAACDGCGIVRETSKNNYHALCFSCAQKGRKHTEESKALMSAVQKGRTCKPFTEEHKANMSAAQEGEKNGNYRGGKKIANARRNAKRRELGHTPIYPVEEGEHEHHFTNEYVGGIPKDVHNIIGGRRQKHRTRVLQWLKANDKRKYKMVLYVLAKELSIYGSKY